MNRKRVDLIVQGGYLITMAPGDRDVKHDYAVAIEHDIIEDLGPSDDIEREYVAEKLIELPHSILMPGMINTHGHLPMIGYCGKMPDAIPFESILFEHMLPIEREFVNRKDFVYLCSLLGARELALSGVTTTVEMYYNARDIIRAFSEIGLRGIIGETVMSEFPSPTARSADEALAYIKDTCSEMPGGKNIVEIAVAPHSPYSCNDETLEKCRTLAESLNIPLVMHAQETPDEMAGRSGGDIPPSSFYKSRPGVTELPLVHLADRGFFNVERVLLAHCIYLQEQEMEAMAANNVGASYNGICNTQIGLEIAPVIQMQKKGIAVGVGTDGPLTNDRIDILSQLMPLLCLQRHKNASSTILSCYDMLKMATLDGARAIGLDYQTGSLEKGKKADIIGINLKKTPRGPLYMENDAVYAYMVKYLSPGCIDFHLVDGRPLSIPDEEPLLEKLRPLLREIQAWMPLQVKT